MARFNFKGSVCTLRGMWSGERGNKKEKEDQSALRPQEESSYNVLHVLL
jgi:hypothetical protein